jgi:phosphosulfolactate synthase
MKINLSHIPERPQKPRSNGLNMVMDKGLSIRQAQDLVEVSSNLIDFIKLGFGTSYATPNVLEKIKVYQSAGIKVYLGGTFLEAFIKRNALIEYYRILDEWNLDTVEVSDGSIHISNKLKCKLIEHLAKRALVLSEVGSKEEGILIAPNKWKQMIQDERNENNAPTVIYSRSEATPRDKTQNDSIMFIGNGAQLVISHKPRPEPMLKLERLSNEDRTCSTILKT